MSAMTRPPPSASSLRALALLLPALVGCSVLNSYPGGNEQELALCFNELDDDFDGLEDCADPDCSAFCVEDSAERCEDGFDNDGDGLADCADPTCAIACPAEPAALDLVWAGADGSGAPPIAPPQMTPCPEGWREVEIAGVVTCDPWPTTGREDCEVGEAHFPGTPGCAPIGDACPAPGEFSTPAGTVNPVYVRAGAVGGDGTRDNPVATVQEALEGLAGTFGEVLIAAGEYDVGLIREDRPVVFVGACARDTILRGRFEISGGTLTLEELTLLDSAGPGVIAVNSILLLDRVVVRGAREAGVWTVGGELRAFDVLVENTAPRRLTGDRGQGLLLDDTSVDLERIAAVGNSTAGVQISGATILASARGLVVLDTRATNNETSGYGVLVERSASFFATEAALEGNARGAVRVQVMGSADFSHSVLRGGGFGVSQVITVASASGGGLTVKKSVIEALDGPAIFTDNTQFHGADLLVVGSPTVNPFLPAILVSGQTADFEAERFVVDRRGQHGLHLSFQTTVDLQDFTLLDGLRGDDDPITVREGANLRMTRAHVRGGHSGIAADSIMESLDATSLSLFDVLVENTSGPGVQALDGVSLDGDGLLIRDSVGAGLAAREARVTLSNTVIAGVEADDLDCRRGMDLVDVDLTLTQASITGAEEFAVALLGGSASLEDVVLDLGRDACEGTPCTFRGAAALGVGFAHYSGPEGEPPAALTMRDVRIANAGACGLHYEGEATDGLHRVSVVATTSAVCSVSEGTPPEGIWQPAAPALTHQSPVTSVGHCVPETLFH